MPPATTRLARIPRNILRLGYRLPGDLFDRAGNPLLQAGTRLTEDDLQLIDDHRVRGLYGAQGWPENCTLGLSSAVVNQPPGVALPVDQLHSGTRLSQDVLDHRGALLLPAGAQITQRFLAMLNTSDIQEVRLAPPTTSHQKGPATPRDTTALEQQLALAIQKPFAIRAKSKAQRPRMSLRDLRKAARNGSRQHVAARNLAEDVCDQIAAGRCVSVARINQSVREFVDLISLDHDLAPLIVAMQTSPDEYLFDHCINVALLSMSTAAQIGWNRERIAELGIGAFLHDVGMLKVPSSIRLAPRPLTNHERQLVQRHPLHTLDYLENIKGVPQSAAFIAYQVHERPDGSGYPNRRAGASLHPYSRIVAIADTYAAMIRKRPYRGAHAPYEAIRTILFGAGANRYDRTFVRAFLDSIALFPVGSLVDLSDGSTGQVVRANPGLHTRPVVEILDCGLKTTGLTVDLSAQADLKVVGALKQAYRQAVSHPG